MREGIRSGHSGRLKTVYILLFGPVPTTVHIAGVRQE